MSGHLKRALSCSFQDEHDEEYDEDYSRYTRVRLMMRNEAYENEVDRLRSANAELQTRVKNLEDEIDEIMNLEMDDIVSLKEDVRQYYRQHRQAQLEIMELENLLSQLQADGPNFSGQQNSSRELTSLHAEPTGLEVRAQSRVADDSDKPQPDPVSKPTTVPGRCAEEDVTKSYGIVQKDSQPVLTSDVLSRASRRQSADSSSSIAMIPQPERTSDLAYPLDAPSSGWFFEAFHYLNVNLGTQYLSLLRQWIEFERKNNWHNPHKFAGFSSNKRPSVLLAWMKNRPRPLPKVDQKGFYTPKFAKEVWEWWASLQPQWRSVDEDGMPAPFEEFVGDLSSLDKHGRNAWLGLLACLKWWGTGLQHLTSEEKEALSDNWLAIIADMTKMLERLVIESEKVDHN